MFEYPKPGTRAAQHMTPHVRECLAQWNKLPTRQEATAYAKNFFRTTTSGATGTYSMTLMADDSVALCFYGIRGGFREVWNFGKAAA